MRWQKIKQVATVMVATARLAASAEIDPSYSPGASVCVQICCYFAGRIYAVKHPHLRVAIKKRVMALNVLNCVDLPSEMSSHTHAPTHAHTHTHYFVFGQAE